MRFLKFSGAMLLALLMVVGCSDNRNDLLQPESPDNFRVVVSVYPDGVSASYTLTDLDSRTEVAAGEVEDGLVQLELPSALYEIEVAANGFMTGASRFLVEDAAKLIELRLQVEQEPGASGIWPYVYPQGAAYEVSRVENDGSLTSVATGTSPAPEAVIVEAGFAYVVEASLEGYVSRSSGAFVNEGRVENVYIDLTEVTTPPASPSASINAPTSAVDEGDTFTVSGSASNAFEAFLLTPEGVIPFEGTVSRSFVASQTFTFTVVALGAGSDPIASASQQVVVTPHEDDPDFTGIWPYILPEGSSFEIFQVQSDGGLVSVASGTSPVGTAIAVEPDHGYVVSASKQGFVSQSRGVYVSAGEVADVHIDLSEIVTPPNSPVARIFGPSSAVMEGDSYTIRGESENAFESFLVYDGTLLPFEDVIERSFTADVTTTYTVIAIGAGSDPVDIATLTVEVTPLDPDPECTEWVTVDSEWDVKSKPENWTAHDPDHFNPHGYEATLGVIPNVPASIVQVRVQIDWDNTQDYQGVSFWIVRDDWEWATWLWPEGLSEDNDDCPTVTPEMYTPEGILCTAVAEGSAYHDYYVVAFHGLHWTQQRASCDVRDLMDSLEPGCYPVSGRDFTYRFCPNPEGGD